MSVTNNLKRIRIVARFDPRSKVHVETYLDTLRSIRLLATPQGSSLDRANHDRALPKKALCRVCASDGKMEFQSG